MRLLLIIGAAFCFGIGLKMVMEFVWFQIAFDPIPYLYTALAFVPLVLLGAYSSTPKKRSVLAFLVVTEVVVIGMDSLRMFVVR